MFTVVPLFIIIYLVTYTRLLLKLRERGVKVVSISWVMHGYNGDDYCFEIAEWWKFSGWFLAMSLTINSIYLKLDERRDWKSPGSRKSWVFI